MAHAHAVDHLAVVQADPTTELVAVYDRDPSNVAAHGELPTSRSPSWAMSNADVAVVASTTAEHVELVSMATGAGLAVFVEKPLATSAAAAAVLAALVDAAGVPFATGMFLRCLPALIRVRTLLADGSLGQLSAAHARDSPTRACTTKHSPAPRPGCTTLTRARLVDSPISDPGARQQRAPVPGSIESRAGRSRPRRGALSLRGISVQKGAPDLR